MKQPEYVEGPKVRENFERGIIALFKVPKDCDWQSKKEGQEASCREEKETPRQGLEGDLRFPRLCRFFARAKCMPLLV
jgi:hypothetical protein